MQVKDLILYFDCFVTQKGFDINTIEPSKPIHLVSSITNNDIFSSITHEMAQITYYDHLMGQQGINQLLFEWFHHSLPLRQVLSLFFFIYIFMTRESPDQLFVTLSMNILNLMLTIQHWYIDPLMLVLFY